VSKPTALQMPMLCGSRALAWSALSLVVVLGGCAREVEPPPPEIRPVRTVTVAPRAADNTVMLTGTVQAQNEINLSFRIDGRLVERLVEIGDNVRPGQLIARLDPQNEESSLQSVRAQLAGANAQLVEARSNFERMRDLVAEDAVSRAQYEQAKALLQSAEAQVQSLQGQVSLAQNRLSYTRLVSDVAGVVTARGPEPGEVVGAGRMVAQVAREGARDAVFDVPAQIKDAAPLDPTIVVSPGKAGPAAGGSSRDLNVGGGDGRRAGAAPGPEGALAGGPLVIGPNLSEWALKKRSLVIYLMIIGVIAGVIRSPSSAAARTRPSPSAPWSSPPSGPARRSRRRSKQVTERLERTLQETDRTSTRCAATPSPGRRRSSST
jgi:hypothetical protein